MADIKITYETLFDLLRRERNREELQQLDATFYVDVLSYLSQKQSLLDQLQAKDPSSVSAETEKARIQFYNVKKILKELYDRREKKLVTLALNKVRTGAGAADTKSFLPEEKLLHDELAALFTRYRQDVLDSVLRQALPFAHWQPSPSLHQPLEEPEQTPEEQDEELTVAAGPPRIRFLKAVPRFAGDEGNVFGPYSPGDEASLPDKIAAVLIRKGRAEQA